MSGRRRVDAKTALIDGVWSTVGSTNLDWLSAELNQESTQCSLGKSSGTNESDVR